MWGNFHCKRATRAMEQTPERKKVHQMHLLQPRIDVERLKLVPQVQHFIDVAAAVQCLIVRRVVCLLILGACKLKTGTKPIGNG
jgi:lipopolysaccharide/colanic/teichoic acid biosynthesis glycosyltransferase